MLSILGKAVVPECPCEVGEVVSPSTTMGVKIRQCTRMVDIVLVIASLS
jgi:hypothetical protein